MLFYPNGVYSCKSIEKITKTVCMERNSEKETYPLGICLGNIYNEPLFYTVLFLIKEEVQLLLAVDL